MKTPATRFQLRRDLDFASYSVGPANQLVVKDPLRLEYFFFEHQESSAVLLLKQPKTIPELKAAIEKEIYPGFVEMSEIQQFIQRLVHDNLVTSSRMGGGTGLLSSGIRSERLKRFARWSSLLAIRFRGVDPRPLLDVLNPVTRFVFNPVCLAIASLVFVASMITLLLNLNTVFESSYIASQFAHPGFLVPLGLAVVVVKILHEFGHGLACRAMERECHELGIMFLVFMPCLYCNVSDIWMEPNRWKRILVSSAGIYVEMLVASVCMPLWLFSEPGNLHFFFFSLFLVCTVNTLLVNGNPLLRYDGYYVLTDLVQIPNLSDTAQRHVTHWFHSFFFNGMTNGEFEWRPGVFWFGVASRIYRVFILFAIMLMIYSFFDRMELKSLGVLLVALLILLSFMSTLVRFGKAMTNMPSIVKSANKVRTGIFFGVIVGGGILASFIPVTTRIYGDGNSVVHGTGVIYSQSHGSIVWNIGFGRTVKPGQEIATIRNVGLETEFRESRNRIRMLERSISDQEVLLRQGIDNSHEIELLKESLLNANRLSAHIDKEISALTILAPSSGTLLPLPNMSAGDEDQDKELNRTSSSMMKVNQGCFVERGEPIGLVSDPQHFRSRILVRETEVDYVKIGQRVRLLVGQHSPDYVYGHVTEIGNERVLEESEPVETNRERQEKSFVQVTIQLERIISQRYDSKLRAVIFGDRIPAYQHMMRLIRSNFRRGA